MTGALKFWDGTTWQFVSSGPPGPAGATGPAGPTGPTGPSGANEIATRLTRSSSAAVTLPTNAWTKIPLDTVVFDTAGNADVANTRVKISAAGKYRVTVSAFMTNGAGGPATMQVGASINGATASGAVAGVTAAASQVEMLNGSDVFDLKAGDTVELMANCSQANGSYTWNANVNYLVVEKIGAGPQGPAGPAGGVIPVVSALPATANDGDEVYLTSADSYGPLRWHMRYNASGLARRQWEFLGGPALTNYVETQETLGTTTSSPADLATVGPSVVLPCKGDYLISFTCRVQGPASANAGINFTLNFSAGNPDLVRCTNTSITLPVTTSIAMVASFQGFINSLRNNPNTVKVMYSNLNTATGIAISGRALSVTPLRNAP